VVASLCERLVELSQLEPAAPAKGAAPAVRLTRREREILLAVAGGLSNKEVAQKLCIEPQTVKNHMHNILEKMRLSNRYQAVEYARARGLLPRDAGPYPPGP
jgi:DNA-binding NarL/FixJ family response regulator